jgi:poly(A) polymerase
MQPPDPPRLKPPCDPDDALAVLQRLRQAGHTAYFAGGCVRDTLLNITPKDWDVATDAPPKRVRELFQQTQAVGAAFGVILVHLGESTIEVATFRVDGTYEDGRRPNSVRFTTAEEDAKRRDFTINGLFLDPVENRVIDYVGGLADLNQKILRAIGAPSERFAEDHLRLLRAVRFAARFSLQVEPETKKAIQNLAPQLKGISPERVGVELRLILTPSSRSLAWPLLWELGLGPEIFRMLPGAARALQMDRSIFMALDNDHPISFAVALAAASLCVLHQAAPSARVADLVSKPSIGTIARAARKTLRTSNGEEDRMVLILSGIAPMLSETTSTVARKKRFLAGDVSGEARLLLGALARVGIQQERIEPLLNDLRELGRQDCAPTPFIDGNDLLAAGFAQGPKFKKILDAVYDAQLEGRVTSKPEAMALATSLNNIA